MNKKTPPVDSLISKDSFVFDKGFQEARQKSKADNTRIASEQDTGLRSASIGLQYDASEYDKYLQGNDFGGSAADIDGRLGDRQGAMKQWANGLGRFLPIVGTKILSSLAGMKNSVEDALNDFDGTAYTDDKISEGIASWEEGIKAYMPIYAKTGYNEGGLLTQMASAKFWADEGLDGLAFMASAAAITYATAGAGGAAMKGLGIAGKAGALAANAGKMAKLAASGISSLGWGAYSASQEAAIEAYGTAQSVKAQLEGKMNPQTGMLYTEQEIKARAAQAASSTFSANAAALLLPGAWEARIILGLGKKAAAKGLANAAKTAIKAGKVTATELIEGVGSEALKKSGTRAFLKGAAEGFAIEGIWEENVQSAIQNYDIDNAVNGKSPGFTDRTLEYAEGMLENMGTTEGQKAIVLGGIIGGPMGGYSARQGVKSFNKATEPFVQSLAAANRLMLDNTRSYLKTHQEDVKDAEGNIIIAKGTVMLDENGNPQVDEKAAMQLTQQVMNTKRLADKHSMAALQGNDALLKLNTDISIASQIWSAATNEAFDSPEDGVSFLKWHHEHVLREQSELVDNAVDQATQPAEGEEGPEASKGRTEAKTAVKKATAADQAYTSGVINKHLMNIDSMVNYFKEVQDKAADLNKVNQSPERTAFNDVLKKGMFYERIKQNSIRDMIQDKQTELATAAKDRVHADEKTITEQRIEKELEGLQGALQDSVAKYNKYYERPEEVFNAWDAPQAQIRDLQKKLKPVQNRIKELTDVAKKNDTLSAEETSELEGLNKQRREMLYMQSEVLRKEGPVFKDQYSGQNIALPRESIIAEEQRLRVQQKTGLRYEYYEKAATGVKALVRIKNKMEAIEADTQRVLKELEPLVALRMDTATPEAASELRITSEVLGLVDLVASNMPILDDATVSDVQAIIEGREAIITKLDEIEQNLEPEPWESRTEQSEALEQILDSYKMMVRQDIDQAKATMEQASSTSARNQDLFSPEKIEDHLTEVIALEYKAKGDHILRIATDPDGRIKEDFMDVRSTQAAIEDATLMHDVIKDRHEAGDLQGKTQFSALVKETAALIAKLQDILNMAHRNKNNRDAKQADLNRKEGLKLVDLLTNPENTTAKLINQALGGKLQLLISEAEPGILHETMTAIVNHALSKVDRDVLQIAIKEDKQRIGRELLKHLDAGFAYPEEFIENPEMLYYPDFTLFIQHKYGTRATVDKSKQGLIARFMRDNDVYDLIARIKAAPEGSPLLMAPKEELISIYEMYQQLVTLTKLSNTSVTNNSAAVAELSKAEALVENKFAPTTQQDIAIRDMMTWYESPKNPDNNWAYLRGIAGTGKTNVAFKWFLALAGIKKDEIVTSAGLKTAAGVVAKAAGTDARSFQELLDMDLTGKRLVVVDEYGTLTLEQMFLLRKKIEGHNAAIRKNTPTASEQATVKVMILGDPTQISPKKSTDGDITVVSGQNKKAVQMTVINPLTVVYRSDVSAINEVSDLFQAETTPVKSISARSNKAVGEAGAIGVQAILNSDTILSTVQANIEDAAASKRTRAIIVEDEAGVQKYSNALAAAGVHIGEGSVQVMTVYEAQSMTFDEVYVDLPIDTQNDAAKSNTKMYTATSRAKEFAMVIYPESQNTKDESLLEEKETNINQVKEARQAYYAKKAKEVQIFNNLQKGDALNKGLNQAAKAVKPTNPKPAAPTPTEDGEVDLEEDEYLDLNEDVEETPDDISKQVSDEGDPYMGGAVQTDKPNAAENIPNIDKEGSEALKRGEIGVGDTVFHVYAETPSSNKNTDPQRSIQILAQAKDGRLVLIGQIFKDQMHEIPNVPLQNAKKVRKAVEEGDPSLLQAGTIKTSKITEAQYLHFKYQSGKNQKKGIVDTLKAAFSSVFPSETKVSYHIFSKKIKGNWGKLTIPDALVGKPVAIIRPENAAEDDFTNAKFVELRTQALSEDDANVQELLEFYDAAEAVDALVSQVRNTKVSNIRPGNESFENIIHAMKGALELVDGPQSVGKGISKVMQVRTSPFTYAEFSEAYREYVASDKKTDPGKVMLPITEQEYEQTREHLVKLAQGYYGVATFKQVTKDENGESTSETVVGLKGAQGTAQRAFNRLAKANEFVGSTRIRQATPIKGGVMRNSGKSLISTIGSSENAVYPLLKAIAKMQGATSKEDVKAAVTKIKKEARAAQKENEKSTIEVLREYVTNLGGDVQTNLSTFDSILNERTTPPVTLETLKAIVGPENFKDGRHSTTYKDSDGETQPAYLRKPLSMTTFNKLGKDPEANAPFFEEAVTTNFESVSPTRIRTEEAQSQEATTASVTEHSTEDLDALFVELESLEQNGASEEEIAAILERIDEASGRQFNQAVRPMIPNTPLSVEQAKAEVKRLLPSISDTDMEFVEKTILDKMARPGENLLGLFKRGKIYVALDQDGRIPRSVLRHEAFHKIFNQYLSREEQQTLKQEIDPQNHLSMSEFDEQLADRFMDWKATPESFSERVGRIFNKILSWLGFARNNALTLDRLFRDIEASRYTQQTSNISTVRRAFNKIAEAFGDSMTYKAALNTVEGRIKKLRHGELEKTEVYTKPEMKARIKSSLQADQKTVAIRLRMAKTEEDKSKYKAELDMLDKLLDKDHYDRLWKTIYKGYTEPASVTDVEDVASFEDFEDSDNWLGDLVQDSDVKNEEGSATDRIKDAVSYIEYRGKVINPRMAYAVTLKLLQGLHSKVLERGHKVESIGNQIGARRVALGIKKGTPAYSVVDYILDLFQSADANQAEMTLEINGKKTEIVRPLTDDMRFINANSFVISREGEDISFKGPSQIKTLTEEILNREGDNTPNFIRSIAVRMVDRAPSQFEGYTREDALRIAEITAKHYFRKYEAQQEAAAVFSHFASHREAEYYKGEMLYDNGFQFRYVKAYFSGKEAQVRTQLKDAIDKNWAKNETKIKEILSGLRKARKPDYATAAKEIFELIGIKVPDEGARNVQNDAGEIIMVLRGLQDQFEANARNELKIKAEDTQEETTSHKSIAEEVEDSRGYISKLTDYLVGDEFLQAKKYKGADGKNRFPFHLGSQALENVQRLMESQSIAKVSSAPSHIKDTNIFKRGVGKIIRIIDHDGFGWKGINFAVSYANENSSNWMTRAFGLGFLGYASVKTSSTSYIQYFYTNSNKPSQKGAEVKILSFSEQQKGLRAMLDQHLNAEDIVGIKDYDKYKSVNNDIIVNAIDEVLGTADLRKDKDARAELAAKYAQITAGQKTKIVEKATEQLSKIAEETLDFISNNQVNMTSSISSLVKRMQAARVYNPKYDNVSLATEIEYDSGSKKHTFSKAGLLPTIEAWVANNYINGYFLNEVAAGDMNFFKSALDMGKRLSSVFGSGKKGLIGKYHMRPTAKVAIIKDPKFSVEQLSAALKGTAIEAAIAKSGIDLADAQAYMTPQRKEELIRGFGEEFGAGDIFKPIYSGTYKRQVKLRDGSTKEVEVPAILKDSVIVLTDELVVQNPLLAELRQAMYDAEADEAVMASGTKEGAPIEMSEDATIKETSIIEIDNDKYRLQLNPLSKPYKEKGTSVPTQLLYISNTMNQALGLEQNKQAADSIYSALSNLYESGLARFKAAMLDENGKVKKEALANTMNPETNERLIALLESGANYNLSMLADKIYSQVANSLTKFTTKVKFPGGKLVQQSAFGIERKLEFIEENGRMYAEVLLPEAYRKKAELGSFILPDGLTYRIPSTGLNSAIGFKVVGYYPSKGKGANIIVGPAEIVTQMGSDFDVDSLFLITRAVKNGHPVGYVQATSGKYIWAPDQFREQYEVTPEIEEMIQINTIVENLLHIASDVVNKPRIADVVSTQPIIDVLNELGLNNEVHVDMSNPLGNMKFHQSNFQGLKLTGIFANISKSLAYMVNAGAGEKTSYPQMRKAVTVGGVEYSSFTELPVSAVGIGPDVDALFKEDSTLVEEISQIVGAGTGTEDLREFPNFVKNGLRDELKHIISRESQTGTSATIQAVASFLKGSKGPGRDAKEQQSSKEEEAKRLEQFIQDRNLWYASELDESRRVDAGSEQTVFLSSDGRSVIKANESVFYASWEDYLNSLQIHNHIFPDTSYELLGFKKIDGNLTAIVKQPYIKADSTTDLTTVKKFLKQNGFVNNRNNDYYSESLGLILEDLHDENVLVKGDTLFFIDTVFYTTESFYNSDKSVSPRLLYKSKQLYSEYLNGNTRGTKEGFKSWYKNRDLTIWQILSALVNSAVDNVKEQQLYKMNASNLTGKMYGSALALGMPLKQAVMLMAQPAMRVATETGKIELVRPKIVEALKKIAPEKYTGNVKDTVENLKGGISPTILTEARLTASLNKQTLGELTEEELLLQMAVLNEAQTLEEIGNDISTFSTMISVIQGFPSSHEDLQKIEKTFDKTLIRTPEGYTTAEGFSFDISNLFKEQPNIERAYLNMKELLQIVEANIFKHAPMMEKFVNEVEKKYPIKLDYKASRSRIKQEAVSYLTAAMYADSLETVPDFEYQDHNGGERVATGKEAWTQHFIKTYEKQFGKKGNEFLSALAIRRTRGLNRIAFAIDSNINSLEELMLSEGFEQIQDESFREDLVKYAVLHHGMGFGYRNFSAYMSPRALGAVNDWLAKLDAQVREVEVTTHTNEETAEVTEVKRNVLLDNIQAHFAFSMIANNAGSLPGFPKTASAIPQRVDPNDPSKGFKKISFREPDGSERTREVYSGVAEDGTYYDKEFTNLDKDIEVEEQDMVADVTEGGQEQEGGTTEISLPAAQPEVRKAFPLFVKEKFNKHITYLMRVSGPKEERARYVRMGYQSFGGYEIPTYVLRGGWNPATFFKKGVIPLKVQSTQADSHEVYCPVELTPGTKVIVFNFNNSGTRDRAVETTIKTVVDQGNNKYTVTLNDRTPIHVKEQLSKVLTPEQRISMDKMAPAIASLVSRFGIPVTVVSPEEMPGGHSDAKGLYFKGQVYLNAALMTSDTAFHEVAHPIISSIREKNPTWFQELVAEMNASEQGKRTLALVKINYPELSASEQMEEALVTLIGETAAGRMDQVSTLAKLIKRLMRAIGKRVQTILKELNITGLENVSSEQAANLNLIDLAKVLTGEKEALNPEITKLDSDPTKIDLQKSEMDEVEIRLFKEGRITLSCR